MAAYLTETPESNWSILGNDARLPWATRLGCMPNIIFAIYTGKEKGASYHRTKMDLKYTYNVCVHTYILYI